MSDLSFEPVSGVDAAWLRLDQPTNLTVITAIAVIEPIELETFKDVVSARFLAFPRFRQKPINHAGLYLWEDDEHFSLDYHVRRVALPEPANKETLEDYIGELMSTPLDTTKPLWQFNLIENYMGDHVVLMRAHHCYADGLSLVAVFGALTDETPNINPFPLESVRKQEQRRHVRQSFSSRLDNLSDALEKCTRLSYKISEESLHVLKEPEQAKSTLRQGLNGAAEIAKLAALPSDPSLSLKAPLGVMKCCSWSEEIPLATFKNISRTFGCSINDVLIACVSGGLRKLVEKRGEKVDGVKIHGTLPVNLRQLDTRSGKQELHELGNRFGMVFVPLSVGIANPIERLYAVKHDMQELKSSMQPALSYALLGAAGLLPQGMQQPLLDLFSNKTSLVLSNVPGSRKPRYIAGSLVKQIMFWVPQAGDIGLGISLLSYAGNVQIGVKADRELLPAPVELINEILSALDEYTSLLECGWQESVAEKFQSSQN